MEDILVNSSLSSEERIVLSALCDGPCTAVDLAERLGYKHFIQVNRLLGSAGRKLYEAAPKVSKVKRWHPAGWKADWFFVVAPMFTSDVDGKNYWQIRPEIKHAMQRLGWHQSLRADSVQPELVFDTTYAEGREIFVNLSVRERKPEARRHCIELSGVRCRLCGFDFGEVYGELGRGFIHVHHIEPISARPGERETNPAIDLVPLCPNCHAMVHRGGKTRTLAEVQRVMKIPPNQSQESTPMLGTSAAEPSRVPSTLVAHP